MAEQQLDSALDSGIREIDFWCNTWGENMRAINSAYRIAKDKAKIKASQNYILADLIGFSVGRLLDRSIKYPEISEVYPELFDKKEQEQIKEEQQTNISVLRFKQFAAKHNSKIKEKEEKT